MLDGRKLVDDSIRMALGVPSLGYQHRGFQKIWVCGDKL
jgi:hypothetical protein